MSFNQSRQCLVLLSPMVILGALSMDVYISVITSMLKALNGSVASIQWTLSIFMMTFGLGQLLFGPVADTLGRRRVAVGGLLLFIVSSIFCASATSVTGLIVWRAFQGMAASACTVAAYAVVRDRVELNKQSAVYSGIFACVGVAPLLGPIAGSFLVETFGTWRSIFMFLGSAAALVLVVIASKLKESLDPRNRQPFSIVRLLKNYKSIITHPPFFLAMMAMVTNMSALFCFFSVAPFVIIETLGLSTVSFSYFFAMNSLLCTLSNIMASRWSHRLGPLRCISIGLGCIAVGALTMAMLAQLSQSSLVAFLLPQAVITFGVGWIGGPGTAMAVKDFPQRAGAANALLGAGQFACSGLIGSLMMYIGQGSVSILAGTLLVLALPSLIVLHFPKVRSLHSSLIPEMKV